MHVPAFSDSRYSNEHCTQVRIGSGSAGFLASPPSPLSKLDILSSKFCKRELSCMQYYFKNHTSSLSKISSCPLRSSCSDFLIRPMSSLVAILILKHDCEEVLFYSAFSPYTFVIYSTNIKFSFDK